MKIAVPGICTMSVLMARRLCEAGHEVHAWNRTPVKADRLIPYGTDQGALAIMVSGKAAVFERASEILNVFGRATHVGPHGTGQLAKLANQIISASQSVQSVKPCCCVKKVVPTWPKGKRPSPAALPKPHPASAWTTCGEPRFHTTWP
jgi:3-hydroxyisobutyrate dehydrogenase-like beta-hydroxyacid dehydrogenase